MTQKILFLLLSVTFMLSCSNKQQTGSDIIHVNDAKEMIFNLSDYVVSLEYVPLETKQECLIDRSPSFYVCDEYIVATTSRQCFLFDRSGKFIREIGRAGRGPDEYNYTMGTINETNQTVLMRGWDKYMEFSFNGKVTKYFPFVSSTSPRAYVNDDLLVCGVSNTRGDAINQLIFINQETIVDSIPNYQFFKLQNPNVFGRLSGYEFNFYQYHDGLYYKNMFNDTIFRIEDRKIYPAWIFDMEQYRLSHTIMADMNTANQERHKYNWVQTILEADPFLLFSIVSERGDSAFVFDKHKSQVFIMKKEQQLKGFYNDIDGGMPFWPTHINRKQELVMFLYPYQMIEILTNEYIARKNIRDEAASLRLRELVRRLEEEDNPVVVIARLK